MILLKIVMSLCFAQTCYSGHSETPKYKGESFAAKYLELDRRPTFHDLNFYVNTVGRTAKYFTGTVNKTDVNIALGSFFAGAIFKTILKDYSHKLDDKMHTWLKEIIKSTEIIKSHWIYITKDLGLIQGWGERVYQISHQFKDDTTLVHTLSKLNTGRLRQWIFSKKKINDFVQQFDEANLSREKYVELAESMKIYHVSVFESEICLPRVAEIPIPTDPAGEFTRCRPDPECEEAMHKSPSVAYALSHRQLNIAMRYLNRRCYLTSEQEDLQHLDILCAFMFREAVYIARRGFFSRDLFMEHIALCGMLGYEEMHRTSWFHKIASWVDNNGCLTEDRNFEINRTAFYVRKYHDDSSKDHVRYKKKVRTRLQYVLSNRCHTHPMSLSMIAFALAIRHAVHHLPLMKVSKNDEL